MGIKLEELAEYVGERLFYFQWEKDGILLQNQVGLVTTAPATEQEIKYVLVYGVEEGANLPDPRAKTDPSKLSEGKSFGYCLLDPTKISSIDKSNNGIEDIDVIKGECRGVVNEFTFEQKDTVPEIFNKVYLSQK